MCLNSCCFCISLRPGVTLIGMFAITTSVVQLAIMAYFASGTADTKFQRNEVVTGFFIGHFTILLLDITVTSLLLYGIVTEKRNFFLPWLIMRILCTIIGMLVFTFLIVATRGQARGDDVAREENEELKKFPPFMFILSGMMLFFSALGIYFWFVVLSLYNQLKYEE